MFRRGEIGHQAARSQRAREKYVWGIWLLTDRWPNLWDLHICTHIYLVNMHIYIYIYAYTYIIIKLLWFFAIFVLMVFDLVYCINLLVVLLCFWPFFWWLSATFATFVTNVLRVRSFLGGPYLTPSLNKVSGVHPISLVGPCFFVFLFVYKAATGCRREDRVRRYFVLFVPPWLAREETPGP